MTLPFLLRRRRAALLLVAAFLSATQAQARPASQEPAASAESLESHLGKGYDALRQERYEDAARELRAALAIDATLTMRARFPLAAALFESHQYAESRKELEVVKKEVGAQPGIFYYLGRLDLEEQHYKRAAENLEKAAQSPPFPDTAFYLGSAFLKAGDERNAEKWLKEALRVNPRDSRALFQLGTLYRKQGRTEEASEAFAKTKQEKAASDKLSQIKMECGHALEQGLTEMAKSICGPLDDPKDAEKLTALGILYGEHGFLEEAVAPLRRASEISPRSPQMQYNLAYTYFQLKRFEEARETLAASVAQWPDLFNVNALYGATLWNLGEAKGAYEALHHAHKLNPQDAGTTALLYQCTGELAQRSEKAGANLEALRYLQEAASLAPADPEPHRRMAEIYRRTGRRELASQEEQKAAARAKSAAGQPQP
ncbi:MAG TPA: tetratricopeptide repeat protein [Candidatus Acidoferrum sp.]